MTTKLTPFYFVKKILSVLPERKPSLVLSEFNKFVDYGFHCVQRAMRPQFPSNKN